MPLPFAESSDMVIIAGAVISLAGTIFTGIMAYLMAQLSQKQQAAVAKIDTLDVKVDEIHRTTNGLTKALGEAKLAQGTAEGTAVGLQQGRDERVVQPGDPASVHTGAVDIKIKGEAEITPATKGNPK